MRSNKVDNSISVNMNMTNSNTLDTFSDNKSVLQTALMRNFNDSSNVSLNFGMQGDNSQNSFEQFNQQQNQNQNKDSNKDQISSNTAIVNEEEEITQDNSYM
jgi:hypothetical protein